jgi:Zn-dependent protease with chaperone function
VTSAARFRRLELALAALGITAVLAIALTALDAVRFHVGTAARALGGAPVEDVGLGDVVVLALAAVEAAMLAAAGVAVLRRVRGQRAFLRRLPVLGEREIGGRRVVIVGGGRPLAFTAGFLRARIWMSVATLELLGARELRAVLAHEAQHAARRDPLRLLAAEALAAAFFLVPPLRSLGRRQAALAELVADAAAVRELGDPRALASALLAFDGSGPPGVVGIAPERVDHLLGEGDDADVPAALLALCGLALAALGLCAALVVLGEDHLELAAVAAPVCTIGALAAIVLLAVPAWLASRRVTRALRPLA